MGWGPAIAARAAPPCRAGTIGGTGKAERDPDGELPHAGNNSLEFRLGNVVPGALRRVPFRFVAMQRDRCSHRLLSVQATDGPVHFRAYQGMDKWDYYMQNRDANLIRDSLGGKAAKAGWWDSVKKPAL